MSLDLKSPEDASVTTLVSGILHDAQELVKQQTELFKHELKVGLSKTRDATLLFGVGVGLVLAGVILVGMMLAQLLQWLVPSLPLWTCYGVMGFPLLMAGGGLFYAGKLKFESFTALPQESMQALKEDVQWITNRK